ncbi:hypothetical protein ACFWFU_06980 [Streptomyces sp. NPDC060235]|uniref:hypothetical protein n=1 Tax=Streptomyces sp. NPDC060235 TaxID=3347080 RepID=UPI0036539452
MTVVTLGGVTVGIIILIFHLVQWWPGLKPLRNKPLRYLAELAPFLLAWGYGCLAILGVGGIVGWAADAALWISNWLGDVALVWGVGEQAGQHAGGAMYVPLTQVGGCIVLILTAVLIALSKKEKYGKAIRRGAWCGVCLGTSAGVAGFAAAPLAEGANWLGALCYGAL